MERPGRLPPPRRLRRRRLTLLAGVVSQDALPCCLRARDAMESSPKGGGGRPPAPPRSALCQPEEALGPVLTGRASQGHACSPSPAGCPGDSRACAGPSVQTKRKAHPAGGLSPARGAPGLRLASPRGVEPAQKWPQPESSADRKEVAAPPRSPWPEKPPSPSPRLDSLWVIRP